MRKQKMVTVPIVLPRYVGTCIADIAKLSGVTPQVVVRVILSAAVCRAVEGIPFNVEAGKP